MAAMTSDPRGGGRVLYKALHREVPPQGPIPYPFVYSIILTEKVTLSYAFN